MRPAMKLVLLAGKRLTNVLRFTVSHTSGFTITPEITRHEGCPYTATWDWGDGSALETGDSMSHAYAAAGTYNVTLRLPRADRWLATIDMNGDHVVGDALAQLRRCRNLTSITMHSNAGLTGNLALYNLGALWPTIASIALSTTGVSGDIGGWVLPATLQNLNIRTTGVSGDISGWVLPATLIHAYLHTTGLSGAPDCSYATLLANFHYYNCALPQPTVDAILWSLYQAAITPRTASGGTINVGGTNAAPSGTYQAAASCPVTEDTDGAEIAWELLNDSCSVGFPKWATVTITAP